MKRTIFFALLLVFLQLTPLFAQAEESERDFIHRVSFGSVEDVKYYLEKGYSAHASDASGANVLTIAAGRSDEHAPTIVRSLLDAGADVNAKSETGEYPITIATKYGRPDVLEILLTRLPAMNVTDGRGKNMTQLAAERQDPYISAIVSSGIQDEQKRLQAHQGIDNISNLLQEYSFLKCSSQYLHFYAHSGIDPNLDKASYEKVIDQITLESEKIYYEIKRYSNIDNSEIQKIAAESMQKVYDELERMGSNAFRIRSGFGKDEDLNKRCTKVAEQYSSKKSRRRK